MGGAGAVVKSRVCTHPKEVVAIRPSRSCASLHVPLSRKVRNLNSVKLPNLSTLAASGDKSTVYVCPVGQSTPGTHASIWFLP